MNNLVYSDEFETLLKEEGEKCESMSILHNKSYEKFNFYSVAINIPIFVLSALIGFLSTLNLFDKKEIFLGLLSIFVGIIKSLDSYFNFEKRAECHRMTSLNYIKISKWIQLQLSLERNCRVNAKDLYDIINNDMENIRQSEPIIGKDIINIYNSRYKDETSAKPAICNGLTNIKINKNIIEDKINIKIDNNIKIDLDEKKKPFKV